MDDVIDLRQQFGVLRRRWKIIVISVLLVVAAGVGVALSQQTLWTGSATVLINPTATQDTGVLVEPEELASQAVVLTSKEVATRVKGKQGLDETPRELLASVSVEGVTVDGVGDPRALQVSVVRADPEEAAQIANKFVRSYIKIRAQQELQQSIARRAVYLEQLDQIDQAIASTGDSQELQSLNLQRADLVAQLTAVAANRNPEPGAELISPARPATTPTQPQPLRIAALCVALGLLVGIGLAFARDYADDGVRDETRLRRALGDAPVLGRIPRSPKAMARRVETLIAPHSPVSEAYRGLNTNIRFLLAAAREGGGTRLGDRVQAHRGAGSHGELNSMVIVSSAVSGEGKTSVSTNLAVAAARIGLKVILLDADLRNPRVADRFGLGGAPGLADILATGAPVEEHLLEVGVDGLLVVAGGTVPPNPAELLASPGTGAILQKLVAMSDVVVVDSAPILPVADTLELVAEERLVLLVARRGVSRVRSVTAAVERVRQIGGAVAGAVYNDVDARDDAHSYGYVNQAATPNRAEPKGAVSGN